MGVMGCDRNNCDNVMCDRLSDEYGYLCWECFDELVFLGPETNISKFMDSHKKSTNREEAAKARFEVEFPKINQ